MKLTDSAVKVNLLILCFFDLSVFEKGGIEVYSHNSKLVYFFPRFYHFSPHVFQCSVVRHIHV